MDKAELSRLEKYLRKLFNSKKLEVRGRPTKKDSCEVYIADEFVGVIYADDEEGDRSYDMNIAILDIDLDE